MARIGFHMTEANCRNYGSGLVGFGCHPTEVVWIRGVVIEPLYFLFGGGTIFRGKPAEYRGVGGGGWSLG